MLSKKYACSVAGLFVCAVGLSSVSALAQDKPKDAPAKPAAQKDAPANAGEMTPEMKKMMEECAKMGEVTANHKLLEFSVGNWDYVNKFWMDPSAPPQESRGTATTKSLYGGRYYVMDINGKMMMPDATGKMVDTPFQGQATNGYDNMKQKFVSSWIDSMGTGIMMSEGTYDPSTKSFTYNAEMPDPMNPGKMCKIREVIKVIDKDKHTFEWYESRDGKEAKTMEITYTRKKAG